MKSKSVTTKSSPVWLFQETLSNPLTFIVDMDGLHVMCSTHKLPDMVFVFPL
jgi:O-acetylhomoserine/O-acetylserine sulfhydrylase-like pyridoxal-dependent enzyme